MTAPTKPHTRARERRDLPVPRLLDYADAAYVLRVSESWLRKAVAAGSVPHTKVAHQVRFSVEHIEQIIAAGELQPRAPEPERPRHPGAPRSKL